MTSEQILSSSLTKADKARKLYDLGFTRHQVADLICGGNYGWAHNIYKKHFGLETISRSLPATFNHKFGVELECYGVSQYAVAQALRAAGISIEVENYNHSTRRHWKIVTDGSINGDLGFEVVSPVLKGETGLAEAKKVCDVLLSCGAKVNKSCGFHVHFDATNLSIADWRNLYKNYITLESEIDSIMPLSRRGNNNQYCRSLTSKCRTKELTFAAIEQAQTVQQLSSLVAGTRYVKVNAESFMRHGTVEFRQHSGTVEFEKVCNWIKICGSLIDKSKATLVNTLQEVLPSTLVTYVNQRKRKFAA
jgi:hypothetical protein